MRGELRLDYWFRRVRLFRKMLKTPTKTPLKAKAARREETESRKAGRAMPLLRCLIIDIFIYILRYIKN